MKTFVALLGLIVTVISCENRFAVSGHNGYPVKGFGQFLVLYGFRLNRDGTIAGSDEGRIYFLIARPDHSINVIANGDSQGATHYEHIIWVDDGTEKEMLTLSWNTSDNAVMVGSQRFDADKGNMFVIHLDASGQSNTAQSGKVLSGLLTPQSTDKEWSKKDYHNYLRALAEFKFAFPNDKELQSAQPWPEDD